MRKQTENKKNDLYLRVFVRGVVRTQHGGRERARDGRTDREHQGSGRAVSRTHHPDSGPAQEQCMGSEIYQHTNRHTHACT